MKRQTKQRKRKRGESKAAYDKRIARLERDRQRKVRKPPAVDSSTEDTSSEPPPELSPPPPQEVEAKQAKGAIRKLEAGIVAALESGEVEFPYLKSWCQEEALLQDPIPEAESDAELERSALEMPPPYSSLDPTSKLPKANADAQGIATHSRRGIPSGAPKRPPRVYPPFLHVNSNPTAGIILKNTQPTLPTTAIDRGIRATFDSNGQSLFRRRMAFRFAQLSPGFVPPLPSLLDPGAHIDGAFEIPQAIAVEMATVITWLTVARAAVAAPNVLLFHLGTRERQYISYAAERCYYARRRHFAPGQLLAEGCRGFAHYTALLAVAIGRFASDPHSLDVVDLSDAIVALADAPDASGVTALSPRWAQRPDQLMRHYRARVGTEFQRGCFVLLDDGGI